MIWMLLLAQVSASNADKLQVTAKCAGAKSNILCLAFSPDGKIVASGEVEQKIRLWDAETGKPLAVLEGHTKQVAALRFSSDGATLYSAGYDRSVRIWDVKSGKPREVQGPDPDKGSFGPSVDDMRAIFNPDATLLASGSSIHLWDLKEKKERTYEPLIVHGWYAFEPGGKTLLSICGTKKDIDQVRYFKRWDIKAEKVLDQWEGTPEGFYEKLALSADGTLAAVVDTTENNKWKIEIWDVPGKKKITGAPFHPNFINGLVFTKDGTALASGSLDKTVKFWDSKSGKEIASYPTAQENMGLAFSADGTRLAVGGTHGVIEIWGVK